MVSFIRRLLFSIALVTLCGFGLDANPDSTENGTVKVTGLEAAIAKFRGTMRLHRSGNRNLVIYHIDEIDLNDPANSLAISNVKFFVASILHHDPSAVQSAFYLFNVVKATTNPSTVLIPDHLLNVATVDLEFVSSPLQSFLSTLRMLDPDAISLTEAVFSLSSGVRGPLKNFQKAAWIGEFRELLDMSKVGLVGATISCVGFPHVETYAFAMRSVLVPQIKLELERYNSQQDSVSIDKYFEQRLTQATQELNFQIASVSPYWIHNFTANSTVSSNTLCPARTMQMVANDDPHVGCDTPPGDFLFLRSSRESLDAKGSLCGMKEKHHRLLQSRTESLLSLPPPPATLLPEQAHGGPYAHLYSEFAEEHRRELAACAPRAHKVVLPTPKEDSQVCFLVRTAKMHDPLFVSPKTGKIKYVEMDLDSFAKSLLMQTNPNWKAYFIITDPSPFERRLQEILSVYNDPRLVYRDVDMAYRPAFTTVDAGYTTTDHVIKQLLDSNECKWISATNGDNAYGSEVVDRIMNAQPMQNSNEQPDMLLLPMDSRNFADQDLLLRNDRHWDRKCVGIEATTAFNQLTATAGSLPKVARVDLAAIVLNRRKLKAANILFGNFSDPERFRCLGCNDGYFAQYLVRNRGWTYARQPVDGLRSLMFHGPSPTYCIAAGNVWFDHPMVSKVGCVSHDTVHKIFKRDAKRGQNQRFFDSQHFQESSKVCLRLNANGFKAQPSITVFQRRLSNSAHGYVEEEDQERSGSENHRQLAVIPPASETELSDDPRVFSLHHIRHERNFSECDWDVYRRVNPDLASVPFKDLPLHYERHGRAEGRLCQFDWKVYLSFNKDLIRAGIATQSQAIDHFVTSGKRDNRPFRTPEGFDWLSYLETNTDLYPKMKTKAAALQHYKCCGTPEMRPIAAARPRQHTLDAAMRKLDDYLTSVAHKSGKRNLVIYHVEDIGFGDNALELTQNNVKVFIAAILHHAAAAKSADQQEAFYWFNLAGLMGNPVFDLIPTHLPNVAALTWIYASSSFNSFFQTIKNFDAAMLGRFEAVFVSSSGVRGPLVHYQNGAWLGEFRKLLDENQVGLVGPIVRCQPTPHVMNHMFAVRSALLPKILAEYTDYDEFMPIEDYFLERLSGVVFEAGYKIASLLHAARQKVQFVDKDQCVDPFPPSEDLDASCNVHPSELLFIRWSGEPWGAKRFICNKGIAMNEGNMLLVEELTRTMVAAPLPSGLTVPAPLTPSLPEAPTGWFIYEEFNKESAVKPQTPVVVKGKEPINSQVCFLVRMDRTHDRTARPVTDMYERTYVQNLIPSLLAQTNPNWKAFLYTTDGAYAPQLNSLVESAKDSRLVLLPTSSSPTVHWEGLLQKHKECRWVSATSGNVVYGSEVVSLVFQTTDAAKADMLLAPMDSAVFAEQDFQRRGELGHKWRCVGLETMISLYQTSYTAQPLPQYGRAFAPSIFYRGTKLVHESLKSGNATMPLKLQCPHCEEGIYAQYLVRTHGWSYARLAMNGLRSTVFDGSSPTYCIASGNVWLDHGCPQRVGCVSHKTIRQLQLADSKNADQPMYDWEHFNARDQICLRLSKEAMDTEKCANKPIPYIS